jgi:hypothetical protein
MLIASMAAHCLGEFRAGERTDAPTNQHGDDVYDGSNSHRSPQ